MLYLRRSTLGFLGKEEQNAEETDSSPSSVFLKKSKHPFSYSLI
ncbi:MAG: hypothetical protein ACJA2O_004445 [Candidatus Azotimanducaceae bacterium]|jgi:hypothetical protein